MLLIAKESDRPTPPTACLNSSEVDWRAISNHPHAAIAHAVASSFPLTSLDAISGWVGRSLKRYSN
ncbi:MAG: hypothetical protein ACFBSG_14740 [Leptolyngbyaceae cyanobacterium]